MSSVLRRSFPQLLPGVLHQQQAQVSQLRQVFLAHAFDELELTVEAFLPDALDGLPPSRREPGAHRPAVLGVRDALDHALALETVDQAGYVARSHDQVVGELAERQVAATVEPEEDAHSALAQAVHRAPPLLEQVYRAIRV